MPTVCRAQTAQTWTAAIALAAATLLAGCQSDEPARRPVPPTTFSPTPTPDPAPTAPSRQTTTTVPASQPAPPIASVGQTVVRKNELDELLYKSYGLNMLMLLVQRDMAREAARGQGIVVTDADTKAEYADTLVRMFQEAKEGEDRERLLDQYLAQPRPRDQMSTRAEFAVIIETNTYLRKLAAPLKKVVTDEMLKQQFDEEFGSHAVVRDIMVSNGQEVAEVNRRLAAGEEFAKVAALLNRDPGLKQSSGLVPPFTKNTSKLPRQFIDMAFTLRPGEVSEAMLLAGGYHVMKLERIDPPKAMKFDDVKGLLREQQEFKVVQDAVNALRGRFAQQALAQLKINDPQLAEDFDNRVHARERLIKDREKISQEMAKQRTPATVPTTTPATAPATTQAGPATAASGPAPAPATAPAPAPAPTSAPAPAPAAPPPATRPAAATTPVAPPASVPSSRPS